MAVFQKLSFIGALSYIGFVASREGDLRSEPLLKSALTLEGIAGEDHGGLVRPSCSRVSMIYPKGTEIANARQLSLMSDEELNEIAQEAEISENKPSWWGATLCLRGIPELSALPPSSRLRFPSGATVRIDVENGPCVFAAKIVAEETGGDAALIQRAAKNRRGLVGSVERIGVIALGDKIEVFLPVQRPYPYS